MTMTADQIVDRRRLRRKLVFWRVAGVVVLFLAIVATVVAVAGRDGFPGLAEPQIARISISGFITDDRRQQQLIEKLAETDAVKGVIVAIDSGGGSTTGGEALYESLRKLADKKPTVATVGTVGASAAYMAALATDHILARRTSLTGSIGVLFQYPEVSGLLHKLGVEVEEIKSAPLKAEPNPFKPTTEEARRMVAGLVTSSYNWFVDIVAARRGLPWSSAKPLADGRVFTGTQALDAKLIDEIGGEDEAIAWLATRGVDKDLPVKDWKPAEEGGAFGIANAAALWLAEKTGLSLIAPDVIERLLPPSLKLDGLLSVWQGSARGDT